METKQANETTSFSIPLGPIHVALEEPMYFKLDLEGEKIKHVEITAGHVHRGMESIASKRNFFQNVVLTERVCSLCSNSHPLTYCMVIENLAGIKVSKRAQALRILAEEIKRVASHLFNVAILAHNVGYASLFMHMMEVREIMQDVKETIYGNRMNISANCIGGVKYSVNLELIDFLEKSITRTENHIKEIIDIFATDKMILRRTSNVGCISAEDVIRYGLVGPVARGSNVPLDVRRDAPYLIYNELDFDVITETGCDVHSRAMVRLRETLESIKIIKQLIHNLPEEGELAVLLPHIPAGEAMARSEAPRGELFYYVHTDGTDMPLRLKWRVPSYNNWDALSVMMKDCEVADVTLIVNSIDPCVSCTER